VKFSLVSHSLGENTEEKITFADQSIPFESEIEKWRTEFIQFEKLEKIKV
jgi:hypothetical protein